MRPRTFRIMEQPRKPISGNAGGIQEAAIGGARGHGGHHGDAGPNASGDLAHSGQQVFTDDRRHGGKTQVASGGNDNTRIAYRRYKLLAHVFNRHAGKDAAIHVGACTLRQGVRRMAAA